jgi:hypothetical protein
MNRRQRIILLGVIGFIAMALAEWLMHRKLFTNQFSWEPLARAFGAGVFGAFAGAMIGRFSKSS